jgi:hypothetical protein
LEPLRRVGAGVLDVRYHAAGHDDEPAALPLHGFSSSVGSRPNEFRVASALCRQS